jgi:hypothetical protein
MHLAADGKRLTPNSPNSHLHSSLLHDTQNTYALHMAVIALLAGNQKLNLVVKKIHCNCTQIM